MNITVLGCGTSTGVPVIGCGCPVCQSDDPFNKRTRASILIETKGKNILIDTSTDLRQQAIINKIGRVDAVLFTHPHADHLHGIDELRTFNMIQGEEKIPCFGDEETVARIKEVFRYIFMTQHAESWQPKLNIATIKGPFILFGNRIIPVKIYHGNKTILGYRIGAVAYLTDCSNIPHESMDLLYGVETLIIDALRHKPHPTHLTVNKAIELSKKIGPERTILTHLSHYIDYRHDQESLPKGIEFAYDSMQIRIED